MSKYKVADEFIFDKAVGHAFDGITGVVDSIEEVAGLGYIYTLITSPNGVWRGTEFELDTLATMQERQVSIEDLFKDLLTKASLESDMVNSPNHYTDGGIESIDYIKAKLTQEQFDGFCLGNALKYIGRMGKKDDATQDLEKAQVYIKWALNSMYDEELDK